jgi:hypothetical protein
MKLIRDKSVIYDIQGIRPAILISVNKEFTMYPKSSLIPFQGLAFILAPFCYMSTNLNEVYAVFKSFFCKYLSQLSSFTSDKNSIVTLIYNFNHYFEIHFQELKKHFKKINFDINVIVYGWISSCFGFLISPNNLFIIYDIILLTDSLDILVLLALSLIHSKQYVLMDINDKNSVEDCLENMRFEFLNVIDCLFNYLKSFNNIVNNNAN